MPSSSDRDSAGSSDSGDALFHVQQTFPVPHVLYEAITGIRPTAPAPRPQLGEATELIHLKLDDPREMRQFFFYMFQDIFHDSQGARSGEGTRLSDFFNTRTKGESGRGLNTFIESFFTGMNTFYGNKPIVQEPTATDDEPPTKRQRGVRRWEKETTDAIIQTHFATRSGDKEFDIGGVDETKALETILKDTKSIYYKVNNMDIPALHTKYSTRSVLKAARPYLVTYDAGSDLLHSVLGLFGYVDISIVNVKDPGDSLRTRNKLLTAIEKIVHQRPSLSVARLVKKLKSEATPLPPAVEAFLTVFEHPPTELTQRLHLETYYVHNYITTRVLECTHKKCRTKSKQPNFLRDADAATITVERIFQDYQAYTHQKFKTIVADEQFIVHKKNIRFKITHGNDLTLLDVTYYFDPADNHRMKIKFNPGSSSILPESLYNRTELNSAKDVGKHIQTLNTELKDKKMLFQSILELLKSKPNEISNYGQSIMDFLDARLGVGIDKKTAQADFQKISMAVYLECMYKFIGDFCQILYSYYMGSIFASFDRSAVAMAVFVMNILMKHRDAYKHFKMGGTSASAAATERYARGLILVTSTTFHRKTVPKVSYYTDYNATLNIERGLHDPSPRPLFDRFKDTFKHLESDIELFDATYRPPGAPTPILTLAAANVRPKPTESLDKYPEAQVIQKEAKVREAKKRVFKGVEESVAKEADDYLKSLLCDVSQNPAAYGLALTTTGFQDSNYDIYIPASQPTTAPTFAKFTAALFTTYKTQYPPTVKDAYLYGRFVNELKNNKKQLETLHKNTKPVAQPGQKRGKKPTVPPLPVEPWFCLRKSMKDCMT